MSSQTSSFTDSALFVKINSDIIPSSLSSDSSYEIEFTVDYKNSTVIFNSNLPKNTYKWHR